jgi:hypothetical protein
MAFAASAKPLVGMPLYRVAAMILATWIGDADSRNLTGRQVIAAATQVNPLVLLSCVKKMTEVAQRGT